jgi:hypothetical protein
MKHQVSCLHASDLSSILSIISIKLWYYEHRFKVMTKLWTVTDSHQVHLQSMNVCRQIAQLLLSSNQEMIQQVTMVHLCVFCNLMGP